MPLKMVMTFAMGKEGWSEVNYIAETQMGSYIGAGDNEWGATTEYGKFFLARRGCLVKAAAIEHVRVTTLDAPSAFLTIDYPTAVGRGKYNAPEVQPTEVFSTLLITLRSGSAARRKLYLGGLPEEIITPPQSYKTNKEWGLALSTFLKIASSNLYTTRSRRRANPATDTAITAFTVNNDGRTAVVTPMVRPIENPLQWYVLIRGMKTPAGWNGVHLAQVGTVDGTMQIGPARRAMRSLPPFQAAPSTRVVVYAPTYAVLSAYDINGIVSRRRGRPFGVPRGRR